MAARTLVLGGARSGKSAHGEGLVDASEQVHYVATARPDPKDSEWAERIATHQRRRPGHWRTLEAPDPSHLPRALATADGGDVVLVDDVATWLTNVLDDAEAWQRDSPALRRVAEQRAELAAAVDVCAARLVLVSAEVGLGVVPSTRSGRLFRDELGALNAQLADVCAQVVLVVAGVPLRLR